MHVQSVGAEHVGRKHGIPERGRCMNNNTSVRGSRELDILWGHDISQF